MVGKYLLDGAGGALSLAQHQSKMRKEIHFLQCTGDKTLLACDSKL